MNATDDLDRADALDQQFLNIVANLDFPAADNMISLQEAKLDKAQLLSLFESQLVSRQLDFCSRRLKNLNQGFYTIGSSGHEGNAALALALSLKDMAFLHYRSGAFMVQRAKQLADYSLENIIYEHLLAQVASTEDPISGGRHKVFGSLLLNVPPQTSTIASHLPKAVGTSYAIHLSKELKLSGHLSHDAIVVCSFGDASLNHSTSQGAINTAAWLQEQGWPLPVIFVCEDNGWGISVPTPTDWVANTMKHQRGFHYIAADGLNICDVYFKATQAVQIARCEKKPVFFHLKTVRLMGHAGSDVESEYRSLSDIEKTEAQDPLLQSARILIEAGLMTGREILAWYQEIEKLVTALSKKAVARPKLTHSSDIMAAIVPGKKNIVKKSPLNLEDRQLIWDKAWLQRNQQRTLAQCINWSLMDAFIENKKLVLFGQDVARKGGVYHVTAGLQSRFKKRVFDSLLDEQSILGTAIGLSHQGLIPLPEIQFLAYVYNALDQIRGEAATLSFFSNGQFTNPMVIRIPSFAYQRGFGGHFHNDNGIAALREIPGLVIACPSRGDIAAQMLRTCIRLAEEQQRVVLFLEPIALYGMRDLHQKGDELWLSIYPEPDQSLVFGEFGIYGEGQDLLIISFGNGFYLSMQAQEILKKEQILTTVVDLQWLAPLNVSGLLTLVKQYPRVLIVDEGRHTGGISESLMAEIMQGLAPHPLVQRMTGCDSFIPLGEASFAVLPSCADIVNQARKMLTRI